MIENLEGPFPRKGTQVKPLAHLVYILINTFEFAEKSSQLFSSMSLIDQNVILFLLIVRGEISSGLPVILLSGSSSVSAAQCDNEIGSPLKWLDLKSQRGCH